MHQSIKDLFQVEIEAVKFKTPSFFFGPLANTMIKAVSNALRLPIIVFSSALHYPVVYTTPRVCHVSIPLYVAFNQAGPGHYSALSFRSDEKEHKMSKSKRCILLKKKYTSVAHCSCLAANISCSLSCLCFNCNNPNGVRPAKTRHPKVKRIRRKHECTFFLF